MQNNAKVGGILSIIAGAWGVFWAVVTIAFLSIVTFIPSNTPDTGSSPEFYAVMIVFYAIFGGFFVLIGVLAIIGGIYALKKRVWGLALAGAIGATIAFFPCGIPAIIFTAMGKPEFAKELPAAGGGLPQQPAS
jgi:hypothetical protein